ncbi:hypothetical protein, partial [Burkholderia cenocepacia]
QRCQGYVHGLPPAETCHFHPVFHQIVQKRCEMNALFGVVHVKFAYPHLSIQNDERRHPGSPGRLPA